MPQPKKGPRLGAGPKHQKSLLSNLAVSLFEHERIRTTQAKAKALRPYAERLITKAKKGSVHDRRQVLALIEDRNVVHKLFGDIGPRFSGRNGGYTRILKLGPRNGDGAPMALIELVEGAPSTSAPSEDDRGRRRRGLRRRRARDEEPAAAVEEAQDDEASADEGSVAAGIQEPGGEADTADADTAESAEEDDKQ